MTLTPGVNLLKNFFVPSALANKAVAFVRENHFLSRLLQLRQ
jgi:hypothetical protein